MVAGALLGSSNLASFVGESGASTGFCAAALDVSSGFCASLGAFAVPALAQCNDDDLGRPMWSRNNFSAGKLRSRSGDFDEPNMMNDIRSTNFDGAIAADDRAVSVCTLSLEDTIIGPI